MATRSTTGLRTTPPVLPPCWPLRRRSPEAECAPPARLSLPGSPPRNLGCSDPRRLWPSPTIPLSQVAAILNLDVLNLYGRTRDVSALGLDQSSLGPAFRKAAAAEGLTVSVNQDALLKGSYFRSDHFPFARAGVPGTSMESGQSYLNQPADYGQKMNDEYVAKRYHQPSDEVLAVVHLWGRRATASRHFAHSGGSGQCSGTAGLEQDLRVPGGRGGEAEREVRRKRARNQ